MNFRLIVTGFLLLIVGVLFFITPSLTAQFNSDLGLSQTSTHSSTYLVQIKPSNYSNILTTVTPNQKLTITMTASPQSVDFFLMSRANFSAWNFRGNAPTQVYPQSTLDVKNHTVVLLGASNPEDYSVVFISRSTTAGTNVLLRLSLEDSGASFSQVVPIVFALIGAALIAGGVRLGRGKRQSESAMRTEPIQSPVPELASFLSPSRMKCRFCGEQLDEGSSFCPYCNKSQD